MGKYKNSDIHQKYSDWHWQLIKKDEKYKRLYVADIDRLWIEYNFNVKAVVAIMDIKYSDSSRADGITATEKGIYDDFESKKYPVYIVFVNHTFTEFKVQRYISGESKIFNGIEYADWLLSLRRTRVKSS
jgi:hypothetical protein